MSRPCTAAPSDGTRLVECFPLFNLSLSSSHDLFILSHHLSLCGHIRPNFACAPLGALSTRGSRRRGISPLARMHNGHAPFPHCSAHMPVAPALHGAPLAWCCCWPHAHAARLSPLPTVSPRRVQTPRSRSGLRTRLRRRLSRSRHAQRRGSRRWCLSSCPHPPPSPSHPHRPRTRAPCRPGSRSRVRRVRRLRRRRGGATRPRRLFTRARTSST